MDIKTTPTKTNIKPKEGFLGLLTQEEMARGDARFLAEINSKEIRLKATKIKKNNYQHSF